MSSFRCDIDDKLHEIQIQFTYTKNIGNRVKQFENLKKKLMGANTCCFSTILVKICAK